MGEEVRPRPRPRFELRATGDAAAILARVKAALAASDLVGMVIPPTRIELTVSERDRHLWSPQLTVDVEDDEDGASLKARYGPHPHVWTLYVALYAISVFVAIACAVWGFAQVLMGGTPWALYLTPIAVVLAGLVYGASFVGQGLGSDQMYALRAFLEHAILDEAEDEPLPLLPQKRP